ncbi:MAG: TetR family transcriptional regulator [Actinobacteria bacterium]|nr:TetR family transcriptional regulator [Actinomycetota bacterium]
MTKSQASAAAASRPTQGLLDAAERLLITEGHAAISTRRVAEEAGLNHGLVHYYFGSMDELLVQVLERFTQRLIERQREMYGLEVPFIEKWRAAMSYLEADEASGYQKLWFELQALSWNRPELQARVARVNAEWRAVVTDAFTGAVQSYGLDTNAFPVPAIVSLVMTFNQGLILEGLSGVREGRDDLLNAIDRWLVSLEGGPA